MGFTSEGAKAWSGNWLGGTLKPTNTRMKVGTRRQVDRSEISLLLDLQVDYCRVHELWPLQGEEMS